jgi:hypothetical protein
MAGPVQPGIEPVEFRPHVDERILAEVSTDTCNCDGVRFLHLSSDRDRQTHHAANVQQSDVRAVASATVDDRRGFPFGSFDPHDSIL